VRRGSGPAHLEHMVRVPQPSVSLLSGQSKEIKFVRSRPLFGNDGWCDGESDELSVGINDG